MLACRVTIAADGALGEDIQFFAAEIESKAKLVYDEVSDWLEGIAGWQPPSDAIAQQITLLKRVCDARNARATGMRWCSKTARTTASCWVKRRRTRDRYRAAPQRQPHR